MKGSRTVPPAGTWSATPARSDAARARPVPAAKSAGKPLAPAIRAPFEQGYGHDFSQVRVHDDAGAAAMARQSGAQAMTAGGDIFFARGRFAPDSTQGRSLLGHELAHVAQQKQGGHSADAEGRADRAADKAVRGEKVPHGELGGAPLSVQHKPDPDNKPTQNFSSTIDSFGFNSDAVPQDKDELGKLAFSISFNARMMRGASVKIAITGHTDTVGSEDYNSKLGQRRADKTKAALHDLLEKDPQMKTIPVAEIETSSEGEGKPAVPTKDNVKDPRNRRVVISVTITGMPAPPQVEKPDFTKIPGLGIPPVTTPVPDLKIPQIKPPSQEWLENHFKDDPALKGLPKPIRDKLVGALKDADEILAEKIIGALPIPQKTAVTAAVKALLETLKGRKFKPPTPPPPMMQDMPQPQPFPKMPGEKIITVPIPLPKWLGG